MKSIVLPVISLSLILLVTGCALSPQTPAPKTTAQLIEESQTALNSGNRETAVALLESASKNNPADATPWLKQAQLHFDADNYPAAIQAADEAMKREPANKQAKAIAVVASLRVAIRAISDMSQDSMLRGSNRSEAERLARALRETLAQDQLVPLEDLQAKSKTKAKPRSTGKTESAPATQPASAGNPTSQPKPAAAPAAGGSPFSTLK
ncbi:outer membrane protein assembly factor BamD [Uliginosibacterium aquaticum]|uniref:Tetratricopeptide repeat protein n=1 Tax=Uliginosibacterium aquaticum TaxID=2731212 RepID=A0ABX2IJZ0_9RHOO|nr:hypothetical protein [Uliginosibacterium aquaticum]NSL57080.1 hypothetical protein [Uliginosibacterium aquaticum]